MPHLKFDIDNQAVALPATSLVVCRQTGKKGTNISLVC